MSMTLTSAHPGLGWWIGQGAIGGVIAGLVFALFETIAATVMEGFGAMFMPIRMISGIVLGPAALDPTYPLVTALIAGVLLHVVLSAIFGAIIGAIGFALPAVSHVSGRWLLATTSLGFALWIVNFYVIAPATGDGLALVHPDDQPGHPGWCAHVLLWQHPWLLPLSRACDAQ
jgi:hypothetical protein